MAIIIRLLQENELELANNFFNSTYGVTRSIEDFKWEFLEGPSGKAIYIIAIDDSVTQYTKAVGIQCAIPIELVNGRGEVVLTAKSEDTLVDPGYRGQKIFERMYDLLFTECEKAGIKAIWGFTPAKKAFERIGFEIPFKADQALMVFDALKTYPYLSRLNPQNRSFDRLKIAGLILLSRIASLKRHFLSRKDLTVKKCLVQSKTSLGQDLGFNPEMYYLHMTEEYVSWRLNKNPFENRYENYQFYAGESLIADVLINYREPDLGYLEQLLFAKEVSADLKRGVILQTIRLMKEKVSLLRVLCFDMNDELRQQENLLKECGFLIIRRGGFFVWKPLSHFTISPKNLFVTRLFTQGNQ